MLSFGTLPLLFSLIAGAHEVGVPQAKDGSALYLSCYNCHSLKPGVHLTGPSLNGLWGQPAGRVANFESYSKALKGAQFKWNEANLRQWLLNPSKLVPGTTMPPTDAVTDHNVSRLVEFLKVAMRPGGYERVVKEKWVSEKHAMGQLQEDSSGAKAVAEIRPCGRSVVLKFADGSQSIHWELNVGYKTDGSARGPKAGKPVLQKTGSLGDRFFIVFNNAAEIPEFIEPAVEKCSF